MTSVTVSSKFQIVIPKGAREKLGIKAGTRLQATADESGLRLVKEPTLDDVRERLKAMVWEEHEVRDETERELP